MSFPFQIRFLEKLNKINIVRLALERGPFDQAILRRQSRHCLFQNLSLTILRNGTPVPQP